VEVRVHTILNSAAAGSKIDKL